MTITVTMPTVLDCPEFAWIISTQEGLSRADRDFVAGHRADIDFHAAALIAPHLTAEWAQRGYQVAFVRAELFENTVIAGPDPEIYIEVANAAAAHVELDLILTAADLRGEYDYWVVGV